MHGLATGSPFWRVTLALVALAYTVAAAAPAAAGAPPTPPRTDCGISVNAGAAPNQPIPDANQTGVTSTVDISDAGAFIRDVDAVTFVTHVFSGDLVMKLTSPAGTEVTLTSNNGGSTDNVFNGTTWDDDGGDTNAPGPATDNTYANNVVETPLVPEEAMGAFIGEDPNGTWTLTVADVVGLDTGTLTSWSLQLKTCLSAPATRSTSVSNSDPEVVDNGTVTSRATLSDACSYLMDADAVTSITNDSPADVDMTLTSPAGTEVTLTTDNGGGNDGVFNGTTWDDDGGDTNAPGPATDSTYANNVLETPLVPEEAMGAFVGEDPNGTWTLTVTDDVGAAPTTLEGWSVAVDTVCTTADQPGPRGADGAQGPPGPAGPAGAPAQRAEVVFVSDDRLRARVRRRFMLRYVASGSGQVRVALTRRNGSRAARARGTAHKGRNRLRLRAPRRHGRYKLTISLTDGSGQVSTDTVPLIVRR